MRLTRRHPEDEHARGPVVAYAAILDGRHLWLALDRVDGTLALRPDGGDLVVLDQAPDGPDDPRWSAVRADLLALLPDDAAHPGEPAVWDVVLKTSRLLPARPVRTAPLPEGGVARTPDAPDGRTRLTLERSGDGHLRVRRTRVAPTAVLDAVDLRAGRVHLRIEPAGAVEPGTHLLLLDQDDGLLGAVAVTAHDGRLETLVGVDDLPAGWFGMIRLAVGLETAPRAALRIRRRASDLADPNHAVLLPELFDEGGDADQPRARLRWNPDGLLALRSIEAHTR